jgi:hypothetical protein
MRSVFAAGTIAMMLDRMKSILNCVGAVWKTSLEQGKYVFSPDSSNQAINQGI